MNTKIKITGLIFIISICLVIFTACENKEIKEDKQFNMISKVRLGLAMQPSSGLMMVALKKGYFKKYGLDIEVSEYPSGKRALNDGLFKDRVDIASSSDVPICVSMLKGFDFKIAAVTFKADNVNRVIARKDAGILEAADLNGKKVATQKASAVHFFLNLFLDEHNILEDDVDISFMKAELLPKRLASGEIDAFSMREPYITKAKELLKDNYVVFEKPGLYPQIDAVVVNNNFIKSSQKSVNGFVKALLDAQDFIESNPKESIKIIAERLGVSNESIEKIWPEVSLSVSLEQSTILLIENITRWVMKNSIVETKEIPNSLEFIYFDGLQSSNPAAITIGK